LILGGRRTGAYCACQSPREKVGTRGGRVESDQPDTEKKKG